MQPWEPSLGDDTPSADYVSLLSHVQDDAVFYPGRQHGKHLDLLLHLSRYSNLLLLLTGEEGSGKTHLKKRFIQQVDSGVVPTSLQGEQVSSANQLLTQLAHRLDLVLPPHAEPEDYCEAIRDLSAQLTQEGGSCLIIIDDAEQLSPGALSLLFALATTNQDQRRPHLVLFGRPELFQQLNTGAYATQFEAVGHHLPLLPFSEVEAQSYLEHRCQSVGIDHLPLNAVQFEQVYHAGLGLPGLLNRALIDVLRQPPAPHLAFDQDPPLHKPTPPPKKRASTQKKLPRPPLPWMHIGAGAGAVLLTLLALLWLYREQMFPSSTPEPRVIAPAHELLQQEPRQQEPRQPAFTPPTAVPPVETAIEPVDLTQPERPLVRPQLDSPDDPPVQRASQPEPVRLPQPTAPPPPPRQPDPVRTEPARAPASPFVDQGMKREAWLMARQPERYTLQMMGSLDEASVRQFIQQANQAELLYFEGRHQGNPWFVVVYGDYADRDAAVAAIARLPEPLRNQRPWARSFISIQNDLRGR